MSKQYPTLGTIEPRYDDTKIFLNKTDRIVDDTLGFIYGAIKKYGNNLECIDDLKKYIKFMIDHENDVDENNDKESDECQVCLAGDVVEPENMEKGGCQEETVQEPFVDDDEFWKVVKQIDWRFHCEVPKVYDQIQAEVRAKYPQGYQRLHEKCYHFTRALQEQLHRYTKKHFGKWIDFCKSTGFVHGLSDDSEWYLCSFIVGCGKEEYDRVMLDPTRISEFKDYQEGFSYCF